MTKINIVGDVELINDGLFLLQEEIGFTIASEGITIEAVFREGDLEIVKNKSGNKIFYREVSHFFRGLMIWFNIGEGERVSECPHFEELGLMIDLSRNAVLHQNGFKKILKKMAILGFNRALLYMEDVYEVKEFPYFGYMRGRYSKEEIQELDQFALKLGIELIPCIQTLAHLKIPLKWEFGTEIKDTNDILLVGEEKTYIFIESMIKSVREMFTTNKIHIGMDEALELGLGKYLEKHGFKNRFDIFMSHLERVVSLTNKYSFEPIIWSDMFLRIGSTTGYYYDTQTVIPKEVIDKIPDVSLMYWDYYNPDTSIYQEIIKIHKKLGKDILFAGGIWTFNGIAPNYGRTFQTTNSALKACKKNNISKVYATLWLDDGAETPIESCYLGMQLFAEHQFFEAPTTERIIRNFKWFQDESYDSFMLLDYFDQTPGVIENNRFSSAASKLILYQDLLLGLYDSTISPHDLSKHYLNLYKKLKKIPVTENSKEIFNFYTELANVLAIKAELGIRIKCAYDKNNKEEMLEIISKIKYLVSSIGILEETHRKCWFKMNKTIGFEVLEIRYGGLKNRLQAVINRLTHWIKEANYTIEELSYERLEFKDINSSYEGTLGRNFYQEIVTPNTLSNS